VQFGAIQISFKWELEAGFSTLEEAERAFA
jgi:hypothetical protein